MKIDKEPIDQLTNPLSRTPILLLKFAAAGLIIIITLYYIIL